MDVIGEQAFIWKIVDLIICVNVESKLFDFEDTQLLELKIKPLN